MKIRLITLGIAITTMSLTPIACTPQKHFSDMSTDEVYRIHSKNRNTLDIKGRIKGEHTRVEHRRLNPRQIREDLCRRHPEWPEEIKKAIIRKKVVKGMTKEHVRASIGSPTYTRRPNRTHLGTEEWVYWDIGENEEASSVYFEGDTVRLYTG